MARRHYNLPPLNTLAAFEAAARHLSFKNAANELSVTPGAVSHQIKALEGELETVLFQRVHRGVELTEDGQHLYEALAHGFTRISQTLRAIRSRQDGNTVTIGSTSAVATLWLSPSVVGFWRKHPEINVNQVIQDTPILPQNDLDIWVQYGTHAQEDDNRIALFHDRLTAVASRAVAQRLNAMPLETLAGERLIHLDAADKIWTGWNEWFLQLGYDGPIAPGVRVNNYSVALQVAQEGAGIALGWRRLIQPLLRSGQLVAIEPHIIRSPHAYYLTTRPEAELSGPARQLRDWIVSKAAARGLS